MHVDDIGTHGEGALPRERPPSRGGRSWGHGGDNVLVRHSVQYDGGGGGPPEATKPPEGGLTRKSARNPRANLARRLNLLSAFL